MKELTLKNDTTFHEHLLRWNALIPALLAALEWKLHRLGANPVEFVTRMTGVMSLILLVLTLMVTPLRRMFGWNWLLRLRRPLGLYSFYYAAFHLATYVAFDRAFKLGLVPADVWMRPFIAVGMLCFLLMVPLAVTSTNSMIKRLGGKRWGRLHKLTYIIITGGVVHYWMIVKSDIRWPLFFALITGLLLGYRGWFALRKN